MITIAEAEGQSLRFSKSGHPRIEEAYASHFAKRQQSVNDKPSGPDFDRAAPDFQ
jgi:hypothetical protein